MHWLGLMCVCVCFVFAFVLFCFRDTISQCTSPGCHGTPSVDQAGLDSQRCSGLCLQSAGIKYLCYHIVIMDYKRLYCALEQVHRALLLHSALNRLIWKKRISKLHCPMPFRIGESGSLSCTPPFFPISPPFHPSSFPCPPSLYNIHI